MVMIDRLTASGTKEDLDLAGTFAQAASDRAGRVGVVRSYAGKVLLALSNYSEAKKHLSAAHRINGEPFLKVLLAECETGLGRPRKSLELLGEVDSKLLSSRELAYAHLVSAEAREALGQADAARVSLNPKSESYLMRDAVEGSDPERDRLRERWLGIKTRLASKITTSGESAN
jgi:tetratricopeptide (TPR) repeat protein